MLSETFLDGRHLRYEDVVFTISNLHTMMHQQFANLNMAI